VKRVFIGVFLMAVGFACFQWILSALVHTRPEVTVPALVGKNLEKALDVLSPLNLSLAKETVQFDELLPNGFILKQSPLPGLKVREGRVIHVTLSSGGQVVFVPDMINKPLREAQNSLERVGLLPGAMTHVYSQRYEAGWVMGQTPAAGAATHREQMVDLKVSKGAPPKNQLLMPDFLGQPSLEAQEWADENRITLEIQGELRSDPPSPSFVINQTPEADTLLDKGDTVELTVSPSTQTVTSPERGLPE
jgi:serine/threonine-protein kinase